MTRNPAPAPRVAVTLPAGYLARHVTLRVGKRPFAYRVWEIQAHDGGGWYTVAVTVDGKPAPTFRRQRDGVAYLETLTRSLHWTGRVWAEPREPRRATRGAFGPGDALELSAARL